MYFHFKLLSHGAQSMPPPLKCSLWVGRWGSYTSAQSPPQGRFYCCIGHHCHQWPPMLLIPLQTSRGKPLSHLSPHLFPSRRPLINPKGQARGNATSWTQPQASYLNPPPEAERGNMEDVGEEKEEDVLSCGACRWLLLRRRRRGRRCRRAVSRRTAGGVARGKGGGRWRDGRSRTGQRCCDASVRKAAWDTAARGGRGEERVGRCHAPGRGDRTGRARGRGDKDGGWRRAPHRATGRRRRGRRGGGATRQGRGSGERGHVGGACPGCASAAAVAAGLTAGVPERRRPIRRPLARQALSCPAEAVAPARGARPGSHSVMTAAATSKESGDSGSASAGARLQRPFPHEAVMLTASVPVGGGHRAGDVRSGNGTPKSHTSDGVRVHWEVTPATIAATAPEK